MSSYWNARECMEPEAFCGGSPDDAPIPDGFVLCDQCGRLVPESAATLAVMDDGHGRREERTICNACRERAEVEGD